MAATSIGSSQVGGPLDTSPERPWLGGPCRYLRVNLGYKLPALRACDEPSPPGRGTHRGVSLAVRVPFRWPGRIEPNNGLPLIAAFLGLQDRAQDRLGGGVVPMAFTPAMAPAAQKY